MIFSRPFAAIALCAAMSLASAGAGVAQSLSDASLALNSDWPSGYMGLGGNLSQAIEYRHRHRAKPVKASPSERHPTRRHARVAAASYTPRRDTPPYLIAQALDHSGLTINTLRLQQFP